MITPDDLTRLKLLASGGAPGAFAIGITVTEVQALIDAVEAQHDMLARLRRYEYLIASDYRADTGRSLASELDHILEGS